MLTSDASSIAGVRMWCPTVFGDERGSFLEIFRTAQTTGQVAQCNHSHSVAGALRGLHYHCFQTDLWYVIRGTAQVALVDLRQPRRPLIDTLVLRAEMPALLLIPPGVAHGYLALSDMDLVYWVTREYDPADERGVAWWDPELDIPWQLQGDSPILSARDRANPRLEWDLIPSFS